MCVTCVLGFLQLPSTEYAVTALVPIPRLNVKGKDLGLLEPRCPRKRGVRVEWGNCRKEHHWVGKKGGEAGPWTRDESLGTGRQRQETQTPLGG